MTFAALLAAMIVFAHLFGAQRDRGWAFFSVACGLVFITPITIASYRAGRTGGRIGARNILPDRPLTIFIRGQGTLCVDQRGADHESGEDEMSSHLRFSVCKASRWSP
jgi:hypothetical protein